MARVDDRVLREGSYKKGIAEGMAKGMAEGIEEGRAEGMAKGIEEGMAKGMAKGIAKGLTDTARKMKGKGFAVEDIMDVTGLTADDIAAL